MPGDLSDDPNAPAWAAGDGPRVAMRIKARGLRYYDPEYPLANMVCTIYGNFPHIDKNKDKTDPDQHHYVEAIGGKMGLSALRLIADAQPGRMFSLPANTMTSVCNPSSLCLAPLIPSPRERDSRGGFPKRGRCDSPWRTDGGLPWRRRLGFAGIMTPRDCARRRSGRRMPIRRGACWRWRRSMTEGPAAMPLGSVGSGCRRCGTGCWPSTPRDRRGW